MGDGSSPTRGLPAAAPAGSYAAAAEVGERTLREAAHRAEVQLAVVRAVLFFGLVLRNLFNERSEWRAGQQAIEVSAILLGILFSAYELHRARSARLTTPVMLASVAVDASVAFVALLPGALWPLPEFPGIFNVPDTSGLLIVLAASGLRLSYAAAGLSALLNGSAFVLLALLDRGPVSATRAGELTMFALLFAGAAALAFVLVARSRTITLQAAQASSDAVSMRLAMSVLLDQQHEARGELSTALLGSQLLEEASRGDQLAAHVRAALERARERLLLAREASVEELAGLRQCAPVRLPDDLRPAIERVRARHPHVHIVPDDTLAEALVAGGAAGLTMALVNLLTNACEGDGTRGARQVRLRVAEGAGLVTIRVADDGPGLPSALTLASPRGFKPHGSGVGLLLVRELARMSGGELALLRNEGAGGACVQLSLPALARFEGPSEADGKGTDVP